MDARYSKLILRFFTEDVGGILITGKGGEVLYEDERTRLLLRESTNWDAACPPPREGQRGERWDLLHKESGQSFMVVTSTLREGDELMQLHYLVDSSEYMELFRDMGSYSKALKQEKELDGLTGLYNKGKFLSLKQSLFRKQKSLAVFNMDVNNLKYVNDNFGHEAGDADPQGGGQYSANRSTERPALPRGGRRIHRGGPAFEPGGSGTAPGTLGSWTRGAEPGGRRDPLRHRLRYGLRQGGL